MVVIIGQVIIRHFLTIGYILNQKYLPLNRHGTRQFIYLHLSTKNKGFPYSFEKKQKISHLKILRC